MGRRFKDDTQVDLFSIASFVEISDESKDCIDPVEDLKQIICATHKEWKLKFELKTESAKFLPTDAVAGRQSWPLLVVDARDLYKKHIQKCAADFKKIQKLKKEIYDFIHKDLPAYDVWQKSEFSLEISLVSRLRDEIQEKLSARSDFGFSSTGFEPPSREEVNEMGEFFQEDDFSRDQESYEFRKTLMDQMWSTFSDEDWKHLSNSSYREEFLGLLYEKLSKHVVFQGVDDADLVERASAFIEKVTKNRSAKSGIEDSHRLKIELKSLYKILANKIHPDKFLGKEKTLSAELWEKLEQGFKNENIQELSKVYTLYSALFESRGGGVSISDLRLIEADHKKQIKELKSELQRIKRNKEYEFLKQTEQSLEALKTRVKMAFDDEISFLKSQLSALS